MVPRVPCCVTFTGKTKLTVCLLKLKRKLVQTHEDGKRSCDENGDEALFSDLHRLIFYEM